MALRPVEREAARELLARLVPVLRPAVDLRAAGLRAVDFRAVDLRAGDLRAVDLRPADLRPADLRVADSAAERVRVAADRGFRAVPRLAVLDALALRADVFRAGVLRVEVLRPEVLRAPVLPVDVLRAGERRLDVLRPAAFRPEVLRFDDPSAEDSAVAPARWRRLVRVKLRLFFAGVSWLEAPASCRAIATACLRFFTFFRPPLLSTPSLNSCITRSMIPFCSEFSLAMNITPSLFIRPRNDSIAILVPKSKHVGCSKHRFLFKTSL